MKVGTLEEILLRLDVFTDGLHIVFHVGDLTLKFLTGC
jgi:hypothetical protein